jgi:hypothetical protein
MAESHKIDPYSPTWQAVKAHAENDIRQALATLERQGLEPAITEFERGRIAFARDLLALADPAVPDIQTPSPRYY